MPKSSSQKRKRKFYGNRFSLKNDISSDDTASARKLKTIVDNNRDCEKLNGNRIIDVEILKTVLQSFAVLFAFLLGLFFCEDNRYGLCCHFSLKCQNCEFVKGFASSNKNNNVGEINSRFVYGLRQIGKGHEASKKLCATLNMPSPMSKKTYAVQQIKLLTAVFNVASDSMKKAAIEIVERNIVVATPAECGVSVDGTWQKRGYSSLNGCVAALSIATGKVLDVEVLSSYCTVCRNIEREQNNLIKLSLKADHDCFKNHSGSASHMEVVGASKIFRRSIKSNNLKYSQYYGDGDSKGYISVKDTYGKDSVTKLECIGHIQKRVGSHLRKLKSKTSGLSGKGKLTDVFIDRLQNYYGIAIRSNVGDIEMMQQNTIAALFHCASSAKKQMHGQCPQGENSWCSYQRATHNGKPYQEKNTGLPQGILNSAKSTYLALCTRELLSKCLHGKTQNANESFNGVVWKIIPKDIFVNLKH